MSINIKKSTIFDPKSILIENPLESDQSEEQPNQKEGKKTKSNRNIFQMPKLFITEMDYHASIKESSIPRQSQIKNSTPSNKASPEIKISWAEKGSSFKRQVELGMQISQLLSQKQILQTKLIECETSINKLENLIFAQKSKNHELQQKIQAITHLNVSAQQFYEMEQAFIKMEGQFSQLQIENIELSYQADDLKQTQTLYERLVMEHNCLKTRCEQSEAINEKYRADVARMKKSLRDFQNDFYSASKRAGSKKEQKEMEISLTEKKLEMMTVKLHEFEDIFNNTQLGAFEKIRDDMIEQYEQYEKQEIEKLETRSETEKEQATKQIKLKIQKQLAWQLREVEKKIEEYKNRMREVKLTREKKSVREKMCDLEAKMTQLNLSQTITSMSVSIKESAADVEIKNKYGKKAQQSPQKQRLISVQNSETLNQNKKTAVPINHTNVSSGPQIQINTQRLSSQSLRSNQANLSGINPVPNTNSKPQTINQPLVKTSMFSSIKKALANTQKLQSMNAPVSTGHFSSTNALYNNRRHSDINTPLPVVINQQTGSYEYENGVKIPTQDEFHFLQHESKSLKTQVAAYQEQIKDIRNEYQRMNANNEELYKQAQLWKAKAQSLTKVLEKIKTVHSSALFQLENNYDNTTKFQQIQLQTLRKQNNRLCTLLEVFEVENKKLKQKKLQLQHEIESLKKQSALLQTVYKTRISQINAQIDSKNTGQFAIQMRQQIERKDLILQKQLEENLSLTNQLECSLQKIKQLQTLNSQICSNFSQKTHHHQILIKNLRDLTFKMDSLTQQFKQKDLRVKKAEENLSVQMAEKRAQILSLKKENKKLENKIQSIKERYEQQIQKRQKKYQRLEQKLIGIENVNQSLKESLRLSRSMQLKRSIPLKGDKDQNNQSLFSRQEDFIRESGSFQLSII